MKNKDKDDGLILRSMVRGLERELSNLNIEGPAFFNFTETLEKLDSSYADVRDQYIKMYKDKQGIIS